MSGPVATPNLTRLGCWLRTSLVPSGPSLAAPGAGGPSSGGSSIAEQVRVLAVAAEASGFDSVWVDDAPAARLGAAARTPVLEAYTLLGALAVQTGRVHLGAYPLGPATRAPSMVAKTVTSLDVITHGRGILTLGIECAGEGEAADVGYPRVEGTDPVVDAVRIARAMLEDDVPSYVGSVYSVESAYNRPKPVQRPGVPVVVAMPVPSLPGRPTVERLVAGAADAGADAVVVWGGVDDLGRSVAAAGAARTAGVRVLAVVGAGLEVPSTAPEESGLADVRAEVGRLFDAGVDGCLVAAGLGAGVEDLAALGSVLVPAVGRQP